MNEGESLVLSNIQETIKGHRPIVKKSDVKRLVQVADEMHEIIQRNLPSG